MEVTWYGHACFRLRDKGAIVVFEFDGLTICHLGDLGHVATQAQVEALSDVDVLLIPVGGVSTIGATQSVEETQIVLLDYKQG